MTLAEKMDAFANVTGHVLSMPALDSVKGQALQGRLVRCTLCDADGIIQSDPAGDAWAWCPQCKGAGMSLDGVGEANPAMYEEFPVDFYRSCATGFPTGDRSTFRENGALDEQELEQLRARTRRVLPAKALLLPAVRTVDGSLVAIGPSQRRIIDEFWRPRTRYAGEMLRIRGFIDRERGHFLDSANAMVRARNAGLVESRATMLGATVLSYHKLVPLLVVRGSI